MNANPVSNCRGSIFTDTIINTVIPMMIIAIGISIFGAMSVKLKIDSAATEIKRTIEVDGRYDNSEQQRISQYLSSNNISAKVEVSPEKDKYDLNENFTVSLIAAASIGTGSNKISLPISGKAQGRCEVYQK